MTVGYLTQHDTDGPVHTFYWSQSKDDGGLPVGRVFFSGLQWIWVPMDHHGNTFDGFGTIIEVDNDEELAFTKERELIAKEPDEAIRLSLEYELRGRIQMWRDETEDMAVMFGKVQAKKRGLKYDECGITAACTGYYDVDGSLQHDGDTCPVHEP